MKKFSASLLFIILLSSTCFSQQVIVPKIVLSDIEFDLKVTNLPDSLTEINLQLNKSKNIPLRITNGIIDTSISLSQTGNIIISIKEFPDVRNELRVLPGLLSLIPPLLAIFLALILRQVIVSLMLGIYVGALFIYDYNPFTAFTRLIDHYIINALTDVSHIQIIVFTLLFGGVVGLISRSGGTRGIANVVTGFAKTRRTGMLSTWLSGLAIFFDDYANTLVVGNLMRPVTDKLKISREKLAFIVDATAAPVASIFIVSSWIGYEVGLIEDGLRIIGSNANAYSTFLETIPYRFYPVAMLIFVFMLIMMKRDFGSMLKAERNKIDGRSDKDEKHEVKSDLIDTSEMFGNETKAKWYNGVIPILVIVIGTIGGLIYTGIENLKAAGIDEFGIRQIISNSDSYLALLWSSFAACVVAAVMILSQRIMNISDTIDAWFMGIRSMLLAVLILTFAWGIGAVTNDIKTADYIISLISGTINPRFLPLIVFIVSALISFSTGTSWGTMAILMPIVIPLAANVTGLNDYSSADSTLILHGVISSVLAGCVFGDHCSPISDTTILSSMASGCDHIDHVRTQLPYAIVVGVVCMIIGDLPTAFGLSPYLSLLIIVLILGGIIFWFGKKINSKVLTE